MTIEIKPETEQLLREAISKWHFASVDELIAKTLQAWSEKGGGLGREVRHTPTEAAARIRELRQGLRLDGIKIRDLINEGRR